MGKKKKEVKLEVVGGNATGVTGSCTKIEFFGRTILFELGMVQDNSTILANYKDNCAILNKIKPKKVEMVIIGHNHCDHIGLIPMLFARGNKDVKIITPKDTTCILKEMWSDTAFINERDCESLNRKDDMSYTPLYTQIEVDMALKNIVEIEIGNIVKIDDNTYEVSADVQIEDLFDTLELGKTPESSYTNVGGFLYSLAEDVPSEGEVL